MQRLHITKIRPLVPASLVPLPLRQIRMPVQEMHVLPRALDVVHLRSVEDDPGDAAVAGGQCGPGRRISADVAAVMAQIHLLERRENVRGG